MQKYLYFSHIFCACERNIVILHRYFEKKSEATKPYLKFILIKKHKQL